jgi:acylphosphatase
MAKRVRVVVAGRVQNVGFRMFVLERAQVWGLAGWVRNVPGGRQVELEAEGDEHAVERLLAAVRAGPAGARVDDVAVEPLPPQGSTGGGFTVR